MLQIVGVLAAVDATAESAINSKYEVKGFPTLKFFAADNKKGVEYDGSRDAAGIVDYLKKNGSTQKAEKLEDGSAEEKKVDL